MANIGRFIELDYDSLPECRKPLTPSKEAEILRTIYKEPYTKMKTFTDAEHGKIWKSKDQNWLFTCLTSTRQDVDTKEYKYRSLRLEGIRLASVFISNGPRKIRMFPNVQQ